MIGKFAPPVKKPKTRGDMGTQASSQKTYVGHIVAKHTAIVGFTSTNRLDGTNIDSPFYLIGLSLMKYIVKKHFLVDVVNVGTKIHTIVPPLFHTQNNITKTIPRWTNVTLYFRKTNDLDAHLQPYGTYNIDQNSSVGSLASNIGNDLRAMCSSRYENSNPSTDAVTWRQGYRFYGYSIATMDGMGDTDGAATTRAVSTVYPMEDVVIRMSCKNIIKIQNVTQGQGWTAAVGSTGAQNTWEGDAIAPNPIKGKLYHFKDPMAIVRQNVDTLTITSGAYVIPVPSIARSFHQLGIDTNEDGIIFQEKNVGYDAYMHRQIPRPDIWQNCTGYANVYLNPGEVKTLVQKYNFDGYINKLLEGLALDILNTNTTIKNDDNLGHGVMDLFCFEEAHKSDLTDTQALNENSAGSNVTIGYQVDRYSKCRIKKVVPRGSFRVRDYDTPITVPVEDIVFTT